jgi:cytochrome c oxidase assembly factor CtaG
MTVTCVLLLLVLLPIGGQCHTGEALQPHDLWRAWSFDAGITIPLAVSAILFAAGARRSRGVSLTQLICFWCGWSVLAFSLVSPLHELGEVLFSAHMTQHEILMLIAAPLMVLARPLVPMLWGLPIGWRKTLGRGFQTPAILRVWRTITRPVTASAIHASALWVWHAPFLFQATLESEWIHAAQHVSFLGSALLFWWSLLYAHGRTNYGESALYIFGTAVHTSILGALLTFSGAIWYPAYALRTQAWGIAPLEDQQVGGLIMWIPAGVIYLAAGLTTFGLWLRESEIVARRREYVL